MNLEILITTFETSLQGRQNTTQILLENPQWIKQILPICFKTQHPKHYKACWIFEMIVTQNPNQMGLNWAYFCTNLKSLKYQSAIRPMAKATMLALEFHYKSKKIFTNEQLELLVDNAFEWLISDNKVAAKVYGMRSLYWLGKSMDWIYPELIVILNKEYPKQSPAYQAVTRQLLKKIN
jgi:hypothetical protein